jgi:hypothetical protein
MKEQPVMGHWPGLHEMGGGLRWNGCRPACIIKCGISKNIAVSVIRPELTLPRLSKPGLHLSVQGRDALRLTSASMGKRCRLSG